MAGEEVMGLTFLVDFLANARLPLLPLSLEHDGILVGTTEPLPPEEYPAIEKEWLEFFATTALFDLPIEIKRIA